MSDISDIPRLNLLIETLTDFAAVPDLDGLVVSLGARVRFLVPFTRCVLLLGDSVSPQSRIAIMEEGRVRTNANVGELLPLETALATKALDTMAPAVDEMRQLAVACYPITSSTTRLGVLIFTADRSTYSMSDLRTIQVVTDACAGVLGRIEAGAVSRRERAALAAIDASEAQRRRISRELHDEMGQELMALVLGLKSIGEAVQDAAIRGRLHRLQTAAARIGQGMHRIVLELRPGALDDHGLETALSNYVEEWSKHYDVGVDFQSVGLGTERFPPHIETTIYRIVQEALTNVSKHAHATAVSVVLQRHPQEVVTIVEDDGHGFDPARVEAGTGPDKPIGLLGMRERAVLVGGTCHVESQPGGTSVFVRIPLAGKGRPRA